MRRKTGLLASAALALVAGPLSAREDTDFAAPTSEQLDAIAADIPDREWYPDGYYDIRIAAVADFREAERARKAAFAEMTGEPEANYYGDASSYDQVNLGNCNVEDFSGVGEEGSALSEYIWVANDMAGFRDALERAGFPEAIIDSALLDFERRWLALIAIRSDDRDPADVDFESEFGIVGFNGESHPLQMLLEELNAARTGAHADLPEVIMADGCGGEGPPVILRTAPNNGQVWIISAFAFRVCTRRNPDPWDKFACRWNEVETGTESGLAGRYVYEVIWPDGTSRRGSREIRGDMMTWEPKTITLRKVGS